MNVQEQPQILTRRFFYDFEYLALDKFTYLPISLGIVPEYGEGEEYYTIFGEYIDQVPDDHWVAHNILPHLGDSPLKLTDQIGMDLLSYFSKAKGVGEGDERLELWALQDDHDRHLFCSLFGGQTTNAFVQFNYMGYSAVLPRDIVHLRERLGMPDLPEHKGQAHNALEDAKWHRDCFVHLENISRERNMQASPLIPYDFPRPPRSLKM